MATTTRDPHDQRQLHTVARVAERERTDQRVANVSEPSAAGDDTAARGGRSSVREKALAIVRAGAPAAIGIACLVIFLVLARAFLGPAGDATLTATLIVALVLAVFFTLAIVMPVGGSVRRRRIRRRPTRIALIGSQSSAVALDQELAINRVSSFVSLGWIAPGGATRASEFPLPKRLGDLNDLAALVERHDIDLILFGADVPRLQVFDELVRLTDIVSVRVCELSAFYEDTFGHIPVAEINSAWFQYVMHPRFRPSENRIKRMFDIVVSSILGIVALPLLLLCALLIKLDGGRVLYRQRRIGEKGRPFTMYKLRTMGDRGPEDESQIWCSVEDPRVTRIGRVLRRLHIDELPQLYNVLRGEMSIVGPRPEQPEIVSRLETGIAFYSRRHLIKPGLAGWAQLRCGYARSDRGSAWKLCHDLYYLKHQSLRFDMLILARTFLSLASQVTVHEPRDTTFVTEPLAGFPRYEPAPAVARDTPRF